MPSKAKRMQISAACYQFSLFSLSPWNYKSVIPTALFIPSVTAGDNYVQEACRGVYFWEQPGRKMWIRPLRNATFCRKVCVWGGLHSGHRVLAGVPLLNPTPCTSNFPRGLWRLAKTRHWGSRGRCGGAGWGKMKERNERKSQATLFTSQPEPYCALMTWAITFQDEKIQDIWQVCFFVKQLM